MRLLNEKYGVKLFDLVHDMFTVDRRRVVEFCEVMIEAGAPFTWSCSARTDCVDSELLRLLKKAGCADVFFGIETGSQRMQAIIDKNLDLEAARQVFKETDEIGMLATASLITGYPEETAEDFRDTVRFFCDVMRYSHVSPKIYILSPLAQTPLTTQYWDRLYLHEVWPEIAENGFGQDAADQALIIAHQAVFPNFYTFPSELEPAFLRRAREFLFYGLMRCDGLLQALYQSTGDLVSVFEKFDRIHKPKTPDWFDDKEFPRLLVSFAERFYGEDVSVAVMARFYQAVLAAEGGSRDCIPAPANADAIALTAGVRIITCAGDVNGVFRALHERAKPEPELQDRVVTVVIRTLCVNRAEILEFPAVSLDILRHAEKASAIGDIIGDFEERGVNIGNFSPSQIVHAAIGMFEKKGLIRRIPPRAAQASA